jgi:hypothetical protein
VVGAGLVGIEILRVLAQRRFPISKLTVLARSARTLQVDGRSYPVEAVGPESFKGQEIVLFANRTDVAEELDRLNAHLAECRRVLNAGEQAGRRPDFLMQELNREANTLSSKSADLRQTNASVELKVLIDQMREQIQNIE